MSINDLLLQLKDIQYQADKLLKTLKFEQDELRRFANYSMQLKSNLIQLDLHEELKIYVNDIEELDVHFNPTPPFQYLIIGAGKKYKRKHKKAYFKEKVLTTKNQFAHVDFLLGEL